MKNFSLIETPEGDYVLSPAYDLLNTRIHIDDSDFALDKGLFDEDFKPEKTRINHTGLRDFHELARRFGINEKRRDNILVKYLQKQPLVEELISRSFLNIKTKQAFSLHYQTKRNHLNKS